MDGAFEAFQSFISEGDADTGSSGTEAEQVASLNLMDLESPNASDFRDPRSYLEYLKAVAEDDMRAAIVARGDDFFQNVNDKGELIDGGLGAREFYKLEYGYVIDEINKELSRAGGPRSSEMQGLYRRLAELRETFVQGQSSIA